MMQDATLIVLAEALTKKTLFDKLIQHLFRQGVIDLRNKPHIGTVIANSFHEREGTSVTVLVTPDVFMYRLEHL